MDQPFFSSRAQTRFIRAYWLTARILWRYLWLFFAGKIFGKIRMQRLTERAHQKTARQIKGNILALKGLFIKVGQMLSIMTQFLPKPITQELEGLQDSVPPAPFEAIEKRFQEEFSKSPEEIFAKFKKTPIASASLGQVHEAYSKSGQHFAVKVQYPDIERIVRKDLKIIRRICGLLHLFFPQYELKKTYLEVREVVLEELNFENEVRNINILQSNLSEEKNVLFPKVFPEFSSQRVLTLGFMEGVKISNHDALKELNLSPTAVAEKIIHLYCKQIFIDGIYHADPHPGNFLVQAGELDEDQESPQAPPKIVMMDFGAVARISEKMRTGIARFMEGVIRRDVQVISDSMHAMGFVAKDQDDAVFEKIVEFFYERLKDIKVDQLKNIQLGNLQNIEDILEFRKLDISWKQLFQSFNVPKEWALLERTLILLMGLTTHLDPNWDPMTVVVPYAEKFVLGKDRHFSDLILDTVKEVALSYLKLPTELQRTLKKLNHGELEINPKQAKQNADGIRLALRGLTYTLLGLGSLAAGYILQKEAVPQYIWAYYGSGFFGFLLSLNLLKRK